MYLVRVGSLVLLMAACTEGAVVEQGPPGEDGIGQPGQQGEPGEVGERGPSGADGLPATIELCAVTLPHSGALGSYPFVASFCSIECGEPAHMCTMHEATILVQRGLNVLAGTWVASLGEDCKGWQSSSHDDQGSFGVPCDAFQSVACCLD